MTAVLPALVGAVLTIALGATVTYGALRVYAGRLDDGGGPDAVARFRKRLFSSLFVSGGAVAVAVWALTIDPVAALLSGAGRSTALVVAWLPGLFGAWVTVVAGYVGGFPAITKLRDFDGSRRTAVVTFARGTGFLVPVLGIVPVLLTAVWAGLVGALALPVVLGAIIPVSYAASPLLIRFVHSPRRPTAAERRRLDDLLPEAGLDLPVRVIETDDAGVLIAMVRGLPGARRLFLSDDLLEAFDDGELRALLSLHGEGLDRKVTEVWTAGLSLTVTGLGLVLVLLAGPVAPTALVAVPSPAALGVVAAVAIAAGPVAARYCRQARLAGDDAVAARTSPGRLAGILERIVEINDVSTGKGRLERLFSPRPGLGARIDRLSGDSDGDGRGDRDGQGSDGPPGDAAPPPGIE